MLGQIGHTQHRRAAEQAVGDERRPRIAASVSVASVPVLVDAAMVRASSAADGRVESATAVSGGGTEGASPGSP